MDWKRMTAIFLATSSSKSLLTSNIGSSSLPCACAATMEVAHSKCSTTSPSSSASLDRSNQCRTCHNLEATLRACFKTATVLPSPVGIVEAFLRHKPCCLRSTSPPWSWCPLAMCALFTLCHAGCVGDCRTQKMTGGDAP